MFCCNLFNCFSFFNNDRNKVWANNIELFTDVADKHPDQAHAIAVLGYGYLHKGEAKSQLNFWIKPFPLNQARNLTVTEAVLSLN